MRPNVSCSAASRSNLPPGVGDPGPGMKRLRARRERAKTSVRRARALAEWDRARALIARAPEGSSRPLVGRDPAAVRRCPRNHALTISDPELSERGEQARCASVAAQPAAEPVDP
jgi:hypothetical protein